MRIDELKRLELTHYGAWIDTNNMEVYLVDEIDGHEGWFIKLQNRKLHGIKKPNISYSDMYNNGWVRVVHSNIRSEELGVQGNFQDVKKAMRLIRPSLRDFEYLYIEADWHSFSFAIPKENKKLMQFLQQNTVEDLK